MLMKDKVALVTGAASGIGLAVAQVWAREGANVVVADVDTEGGEKAVADLKAQGEGDMSAAARLLGHAPPHDGCP